MFSGPNPNRSSKEKSFISKPLIQLLIIQIADNLERGGLKRKLLKKEHNYLYIYYINVYFK